MTRQEQSDLFKLVTAQYSWSHGHAWLCMRKTVCITYTLSLYIQYV